MCRDAVIPAAMLAIVFGCGRKTMPAAETNAAAQPAFWAREAKPTDEDFQREYHRRQAAERRAVQQLEASGLRCKIEPLVEGQLAKLAEQEGLPPVQVVVGVSDILFKTRDNDLAPLAALSEVAYLSLSGTKLTDKGVGHIAGLSKLQVLYVGDTAISDEGLAHLKGLSGIRELWLRGTRVTDAGMVCLEELPNLQTLLIGRTALGDAGLAHLGKLRSLTTLGLDSTQVTDAGLVHLKGLSRLQYLDLYNTHVTDAGVAELRGWLPGVRINRDPPPRKH